jgi:peptidoglycan-associated lipoprotein
LDRRNRILFPVVLFVALVAVAGCKKKVTPPPVPTAPPVVAATPTANITASPTVVTAGDPVVLTWNTTNAATVSIDGLGDVPTSGVKTVTPTVSTSYHLLAKGAGGSADASVRVTVNAPPAVAAPANTMSAEEEFKANVQDIFFEYDKYDVSADAHATLARDAEYLLSHTSAKILIGGYCDERGSNEYNVALGQNRANFTKKALVDAGVDASRIRVISYGKEKPFCTEATESCWQKNRRAGFSLDR